MLAAKNGHDAIIGQLLDAGADLNHTNNERTALFSAALNGVARLLKAGAEVNHAGNDGWTALLFAAKNGHAAVVDHLLRANADVDATKDGATALMLAALSGHEAIVVRLLEAGANVRSISARHDTEVGRA